MRFADGIVRRGTSGHLLKSSEGQPNTEKHHYRTKYNKLEMNSPPRGRIISCQEINKPGYLFVLPWHLNTVGGG